MVAVGSRGLGALFVVLGMATLIWARSWNVSSDYGNMSDDEFFAVRMRRMRQIRLYVGGGLLLLLGLRLLFA